MSPNDMKPQKITSFREFWPFYLQQHMDPRCRALHLFGTAFFIGSCFLSVFLHQYIIMLIFAVILAYGLAWVGHFVFERNSPATFSFPFWSLCADFKMFYLFLCGKLNKELVRYKSE